jgi:hypothetical protein
MLVNYVFYPTHENDDNDLARTNGMDSVENSNIFNPFSSYLEKIAEVMELNAYAFFSTHPPRAKKPLKVREILETERAQFSKIAKEWTSLAQCKEIQAELIFPNLLNSIPILPYCRYPNLFEASSGICENISSALEDDAYQQKVYACYVDQLSSEEKIEAIAIAHAINRRPRKPSYLILLFLASHPKNLISSVNRNEPDQVSGAAAKLINHLTLEVCPQLKMEQIRLTTTSNARSFYENLGFTYKNFKMKLKINPPSK